VIPKAKTKPTSTVKPATKAVVKPATKAAVKPVVTKPKPVLKKKVLTFSPPAGCKTKPVMTGKAYQDSAKKWKVKLSWTAVTAAKDYHLYGNADGWANLPTFKDLSPNWSSNAVILDLETDRLNEFWVRANPSTGFKCINKTSLTSKETRSYPTSNVWTWPPNPCILDKLYKFKIIDGFTLCY